MKTFPNTKDDWVALFVFPFKVYVLLAYPFLLICLAVRRMFESSHLSYTLRNSDASATYAVSQVYALCLAMLLLGALVQAIFCQRGRATQTVGLFFLGCIIFWMFKPWGMFVT